MIVYRPRIGGPERPGPDLGDLVRQDAADRAVVISSAEVYGAHHSNPGRMLESRQPLRSGNSVQKAWLDYEELARKKWPADRLVILRCAPVITRDGRDFYSDMFRSDRAFVLPGHVGTLQLLHPDDFEEAIRCASANFEPGVYNIAPAGSIPLDAALELAGGSRIPFPRLAQYAIRGMMHGKAWPADQLEYIRYQWTVSGELAQRKLGFTPKYTSAQTLKPDTTRTFDEYGMDIPFIQRWGRGGFNILHKHYWRIETRGLANIPRTGKAVLTGVHRGFMPFDATMILDTCMKSVGRAPRFLIHPCLLRRPGLNNAMTRWGGMVANQENADWVLNRGELLGVYPEGIRGAFSMYKDAYKLKRFGRDDYVRLAIRHRAPIVPFVTVGHVEIFPILGRIDIPAFNRWTEWPFCPITPTWPLLPVPLPSKWHTEFLPQVDLSAHPPEAADDNALVKRIGEDIKGSMQDAIDRLLAARKGIFTGTIFQGELS